jgi:hypothetical protein
MEAKRMSLNSIYKDYDELVEFMLNEKITEISPIDNSVITILTLFLSIGEKAKSIDILMKNKQYTEIKLITRAFFEQLYYLKFIFEKNTTKRADCLFSYSRFMNVDKAKKAMEGFSDQELAATWGTKIDEHVKTGLAGRETFQEEYDFFENKYREMFPDGTRNNQMKKWYDFESPGQIPNFRKLLEYLNVSDLYIGIYAPYSDNVHGSNAPDILSFTDYDKDSKTGTVEIKYEIPTGDIRMIEAEMKLLFMEMCNYFDLNKAMQTKLIRYRINAERKFDVENFFQ